MTDDIPAETLARIRAGVMAEIRLGKFEPFLCACGCGRSTEPARETRAKDGIEKGRPLRYIHGHSGGKRAGDPVTRFWSWVDQAGPDECWTWRGGMNNRGYGKFWHSGGTMGAHRFSLELKLGRELAPDEVTRHTCDNPPCCNPAHLLVGTLQDNVDDAVVRDRHAAGIRNGRAKLTEADVIEIRRRYSLGGLRQVDLAHEYGVSRSAIFYVTSGQHWRAA